MTANYKQLEIKRKRYNSVKLKGYRGTWTEAMRCLVTDMKGRTKTVYVLWHDSGEDDVMPMFLDSKGRQLFEFDGCWHISETNMATSEWASDEEVESCLSDVYNTPTKWESLVMYRNACSM